MKKLNHETKLVNFNSINEILDYAIMNEKERFGRVRTILMKQLRAKYGDDIANRALYRINKRISEGSLRVKVNLNTINHSESEI